MSVEFLPELPVRPDGEAAGSPTDAADAGPDEPPALSGPLPPRPRRRWLRSLTSRLVAGVVVLVVLLVLAIGSSTYYALRSFLDERLDQQLAPIADTNQQRISQCFLQEPLGCDILGPGHYRAAQTEWLTVLDSTGAPAASVTTDTDALKSMSLSKSQRTSLAAHQFDVRTLTTTDGVQLRVSARPIEANGSTFVVISGLSTAQVTDTLHRVVTIELIIGLAAVSLALVATTLGVRRSLRNLYRVTGTAQEVVTELTPTGAGLQRRVPVADEGSEVGQLAQSFNTMLAAVETQFAARVESEQRMRQFLADASHELRTPLTSIRGYAELARMQRAAGRGAAGDEDGDNLDRIESEGTRMSRLVDDLLLLARGDDGTNAARADEPVDLAGVLEDVVHTARVAHPDRPIELELTDLPAVVGDRDQLLRAVRNLVTNAAVHTEAGRPIRVTGTTDGQEVVVQVADGGPGLPPEQAAHVFERFWRADKARTRARGGTGLGMSIVDAIVRSHGGTVRFDSDVARGSTVTIRLPAPAVVVAG